MMKAKFQAADVTQVLKDTKAEIPRERASRRKL